MKQAATKIRQSELNALVPKKCPQSFAQPNDLAAPSIIPHLLARPFDDTTPINTLLSIVRNAEKERDRRKFYYGGRPPKDYSAHFGLTRGQPVTELGFKKESFVFENDAALAECYEYAGSFRVTTQPHPLVNPNALHRLGRLFSRSEEREVPITREACRKVTTLWHGTKLENLRSILTNGLCLAHAKSGLLGTGIYLTPDIMKCMSYTSGVNNTIKVILECKVRLGNVFNSYDERETDFQMPKDKTELWKLGYHSLFAGPKHTPSTVWGGATRFREFAVFDPKQVVIECIHIFKRKVYSTWY